MAGKSNVVRVPIVTTEGELWQTLACLHDNFKNPVVMGSYETLEIARKHYFEDMRIYKENGGGFTNFGIRKFVKKEETND